MSTSETADSAAPSSSVDEREAGHYQDVIVMGLLEGELRREMSGVGAAPA
ncbi:MAG: hypothetical protein U0446_02750 [Dehalococcoidia bacterium]